MVPERTALAAAAVAASVGLLGCSAPAPSSSTGPEAVEVPPPPAPPAPPPTPPAPPPPPTRVVIISQDGLAADALTPELAPTQAAFAASGMTARLARTVGPSETLPTHASMLSGVPPTVHGMTWDSYIGERGFIEVPTLFSVAHDHGMSTAMLVAKPKLQHIARTGTIDLYERPGFDCAIVARRAVRLLRESPPIVTFMHFANPDDAGHGRGWRTPAYQAAVTANDACVATVLAAIDELGLAPTTYVFVTADHGGHERSHSAKDDRIRVIPWMVRGPGVTPGAIVDEEMSTMDTAATAMAVLGLPIPPGVEGVARLPAGPRAVAPDVPVGDTCLLPKAEPPPPDTVPAAIADGPDEASAAPPPPAAGSPVSSPGEMP